MTLAIYEDKKIIKTRPLFIPVLKALDFDTILKNVVSGLELFYCRILNFASYYMVNKTAP